MQLLSDFMMEFKADFSKFTSECRVRIYNEENTSQVIIIISQPIDQDGNDLNTGTSITNAAELLSTVIMREIDIEPVAWIHHWPERGPEGDKLPEEFNLVEFTLWANERYWAPKFIHISRADVEAKLGTPLEP